MTDDDLRDHLRRADPAASLAPAAPDEITRLLGEAMTTATTTTRPAGNRRRLFALAAAALVLIAAGLGWALNRPDESKVQLTASGVRAKCVQPSAEHLAATADFAFAGTVDAITGKVVALKVTHVYRGTATGTVEVAQAGDTSEQMLGSGTFERGRDYLVASAGGTVMICGYSGEADAIGLRDMYEAAF